MRALRLLWPSCCLLACTAALPASAEGLRFAQPVLDAGQVLSGAPLVQRFPFTNDTSWPVTLGEVRVSCGCLVPRLESPAPAPASAPLAPLAIPHTFQPGESGVLVLAVNTLSQGPGPHSWQATVRCQVGPQVVETELAIRGRVLTEVSVRPAVLTVFTEAAAAHEIQLTDLRPQPLAITAVQGSSPALTGRVTQPIRDEQGHWGYRINLEVAPDYPEGRHEEALDIITNDPVYRDLRVAVTVVKSGRQRLSASPESVTLLAPAGQEVPTRIVLVRDREDQPVVVEGVVADDPAVTCTWAQGPNHLATVKVRVDRTRLTGPVLHSAVHITVSGPVRQTLTLPVTCRLD